MESITGIVVEVDAKRVSPWVALPGGKILKEIQ